MSEGPCNVCLVGADDIDNAFYADSEVTAARKQHQCCECLAPILPGQPYTRSVGKSDGHVWTYKTCASCHEVRTTFYCEGSWLFGLLWDDMQEQAFPELTTASPCFRELSTAAKGLVLDRWRAWKGLR